MIHRRNPQAMLALAAALFSGVSVSAHGNVDVLTIGGVAHSGWLINTDPYSNPIPERIMRKIPGNGPVEDVSSIDLQCNRGAEPAPLVAAAKAGDTIDFHWVDWPESHKGPVLTYLAKAPEGTDITTWVPGSDAVWFKIDEAGFADGKWAGTDVLFAQGNTWTSTLPSQLPSGQYLVRHELIALHSAGTAGGAQFYPSCSQIEVTGTATEGPDSSFLVSFPGAYSSSDPGITVNIYQDLSSFSYTIPGPVVWPGDGSVPAPIPAPSSTQVAAPVPSTSVAAPPVSSSIPTSVAAPTAPATTVPSAPTTIASPPASTGTTSDCNTCMNEYNRCIDNTQPTPDWTGCSALKDTCMDSCSYNRKRMHKRHVHGAHNHGGQY